MTVTTVPLGPKKARAAVHAPRVVKKRLNQDTNWGVIRNKTVLLSGIERHNLIQAGLSARIVKAALETFHEISQDRLMQAIGLSTKTLGRREEALLGPRHSDASMALIDVTDTAHRVLGSRDLAERWLADPALALDGRCPLDLLTTTPGIEAVKDLLTRMEYGVYA